MSWPVITDKRSLTVTVGTQYTVFPHGTFRRQGKGSNEVRALIDHFYQHRSEVVEWGHFRAETNNAAAEHKGHNYKGFTTAKRVQQ